MNAKKEFLSHIERKVRVKCVSVVFGDQYPDYDEEGNVIETDPYKDHILLPVNYTEEQYNEFLTKLDREYNCGYGGQELYGVIWFEDNTWSDRGEYDGSEWWQYQYMPIIPEILL